MTGKLIVAKPGWLMLAACGTLMMAERERLVMAKQAGKVDRGRCRASGEFNGKDAIYGGI